MTRKTVATVRASFALLALGLTLYAGADSLARSTLEARTVGLSTCGTADAPCTLQPLQVTAAAHRVVSGTPVANVATPPQVAMVRS